MGHEADDSQKGAAQHLAAALGNLRRISTQFDEMAGSTSPLLIAVARRYRVVACVSGRTASDARRVVSIGSIAYVGNHGGELLRPGAAPGQVDGHRLPHHTQADETHIHRYDLRARRYDDCHSSRVMTSVIARQRRRVPLL